MVHFSTSFMFSFVGVCLYVDVCLYVCFVYKVSLFIYSFIYVFRWLHLNFCVAGGCLKIYDMANPWSSPLIRRAGDCQQMSTLGMRVPGG